MKRREFIIGMSITTLPGLAASKQALVYVGTYTNRESKGVYAFRFDYGTGKLTEIGLAAETPSPSFLVIHPNGRYLYAVSELSKFKDQESGALNAFEIDNDTGQLKKLNDQPTGGTSPCHIAIDRVQRNILVVNYGTGSTAVFRLNRNGSLGERTAFVAHKGSSIHPRQQGPHAHSVNLSKNGRFAVVADLGMDEYIVYSYDETKGTITPHSAAKPKPGSGPRHFTFHPSYKLAYGVNEIGSSVSAFRWDETTGTLTEIQNISTLPEGASEKNSCAEILAHPNGKFVYASNRGHDSLAMFAIDEKKGTLTSIGNTPTQGRTPRNFRIDPTGKWIIAANQDSGTMVVFQVDASTGKLSPGQEVKVPFPVCVKFL